MADNEGERIEGFERILRFKNIQLPAERKNQFAGQRFLIIFEVY